jgi:hypothetical protein
MIEDTNKYVQKFADEERMFEAVKDEIMNAVDLKNIDTKQNNEDLGAEVRAHIRAKEMVEVGFRHIKALRTVKTQNNGLNIAR